MIKYTLVLLLIGSVINIRFDFNIPIKSMKCIGEYLTEGTFG